MMLPHGPDVDAFESASNADLKPHKLEGTLAFMFETRFPQRVTAYAAQSDAFKRTTARMDSGSKNISTRSNAEE